jgi:2-C-methyl-D-erythritol 4-phosphate cytidylyltransferase
VRDAAGAVLVAAGASRRMGFDKLWANLGDRPVLSHALNVLVCSPRIAQTAVVVSSERLADARALADRLKSPVVVCKGGGERRDSVAAGLDALDACEWVLVHDAARPFLTQELIDQALDAARSTGAAVAAIPARDTLKHADAGTVVGTLPRDDIWSAQTPQVFRADLLRLALERPDRDVTDEASLVERMGRQVRLFAGSETNFKITTPVDLELAEAWLAYVRRGDAAKRRSGETDASTSPAPVHLPALERGR